MTSARTTRSMAQAQARGTGPARRRFNSTPAGVVIERSVSSPDSRVSTAMSVLEVDVAVGGVDRRHDHRAQDEPSQHDRQGRDDAERNENQAVDEKGNEVPHAPAETLRQRA